MPPYLAGRTHEQEEVRRLLDQKIILENVVLTGLRGVGKTVLLETFKPIARERGWLWAGADLSESVSVSEERLALRLLADIALVTSSLVANEKIQLELGFAKPELVIREPLNFSVLANYYNSIPGLVSDKIKSTLEYVWSLMPQTALSGIVFAYDEAQTLSDHARKDEYPLSLLLDVFQSIQRMGIPFMLILTGLPTLFPKLVEARTYSERMFHIMFLTQLDAKNSRDAIVKPTEYPSCPLQFSESTAGRITHISGGYPYFIQFICREAFDVWLSKMEEGEIPSVPEEEIVQKLDTDFFAGRWARATDRQRQLLQVIASLSNCDYEFTVQEVVNASKRMLDKAFSSSHANQMLSSLSDSGLIYKNRHGKYSFAVPLLSGFIRRQSEYSEK